MEKSSLTQPAKEAIKILAQGVTPSGKQVGRPDLMNIINFMLKTFECIISPSTHQSEHTEEKPFSCSKCDQKFGKGDELKMHESDHTEEKPFKCPKCDITFSNVDDGCEHAETIIDLEMDIFSTQVEWDEPKKEPIEEKPFACPKCDKKFSSEAEVKIHEKPHTGEKPVPICRHLKAGKWKFGIKGKNNEGKCPFRHIPKCNKFMRNAKGCSDKECKFLHPFVCRLPYLNSGRCERSDCTFAHIKKEESARALGKPDPTNARPETQDSQLRNRRTT